MAYAHRTRAGARHTGYNLRGIPIPAAVVPAAPAAPHPRQVVKNTVARRIRNEWLITRQNRRSRGLGRNGNTCFRLSGLQALLHLPKFLQWIISHNSTQGSTTVFPCRPVAAIQAQLAQGLTLGKSDISKKKKDEEQPEDLEDCSACAVKALAQLYWGSQDINATGHPRPLRFNDALLDAVHDVDDALRMFTPGAGTGNAQQDPEEMQTRLLTACLESVDHTLAVNTEWRTRYEALFILQLDLNRTCACGAARTLPAGTNVDGIGFNNVAILPPGTRDSVTDAMHRHFTPSPLGNLPCGTCNMSQPFTESIHIEGSPEYLRIKLSIVHQGAKNFNPVVLNEYLDLAQYQTVGGNPPSLKYRLSSVLSHYGRHLDSGHWVASARGPDHVFYINDATVTQQDAPSRLRANPQMKSQAVVLMYRRVHTR